jgi:hypothetical protein
MCAICALKKQQISHVRAMTAVVKVTLYLLSNYGLEVLKMKSVLFIVVWMATLSLAAITFATEVDNQQVLPDPVLDSSDEFVALDPADWGIRNDCVSRSRIRNIRFVDDQTAIIDMMGKKKILLTMRKECRGIKRHGYITQVRGNQLCARFDRFEVIDRGMICAVGSLEPFIPPVETNETDAIDKSSEAEMSADS